MFEADPLQRALLSVGERNEPFITRAESGVDPKQFRRSRAYVDYYRPHDLEHLLGVWLRGNRYGLPGMTGILLARSRREPEFTKTDLRLIEAALPALQAAARRSVRAEAVEAERRALAAMLACDPAERARAVFDAEGRTLWCSPSAATILEAVEGGRRGPPAELAERARRLAAIARGSRAGAAPAALEPEGLVASKEGRLYRFELTVARTDAGEPIVVATLDFAGLAPGPLAGFARRFGLTGAEAQVLNALTGGRTNAEVARRLFVSVETVRTHVHRILGKLRAASRAEAAALLRAWPGQIARAAPDRPADRDPRSKPA
jgi:DNA-binding CsgD family transcriptional regulator